MIVLIIGDTSYKTEAYHCFSNFINFSNVFYVFVKFIDLQRDKLKQNWICYRQTDKLLQYLASKNPSLFKEARRRDPQRWLHYLSQVLY